MPPRMRQILIVIVGMQIDTDKKSVSI